MGEHSASSTGLKARARAIADKLWTHRRKITSALIVALPFASRYVPGFPTDEALAVLRAFLGA